jgi:hypothetical protein
MSVITSKLKRSTYRLNRLVHGDNSHIEIRNFHSDPFEVLEGTTLLVKIHSVGSLVPATVKIEYAPDQHFPAPKESSNLAYSPIKRSPSKIIP